MVLTAIVSIQVGAALATKLFPVLGALGTVSYRILFAALVLMLVCRPRVGRVFAGSSGIALGMSVATILLLPFAVGPAPALFSSATLLAVMVGVALLSTAIPFSLEFHALKHLTPTVYGALISLEPAVAAMVGALILGEVLGGRGLLAVGCVTVAAVGTTLKKRRPSDQGA